MTRIPSVVFFQSSKVECRLLRVRRQLGFSLQALADGARVSRNTIYRIEKGHLLPSIGTALRLAKTLDVLLEEIFISYWLTPNEWERQRHREERWHLLTEYPQYAETLPTDRDDLIPDHWPG